MSETQYLQLTDKTRAFLAYLWRGGRSGYFCRVDPYRVQWVSTQDLPRFLRLGSNTDVYFGVNPTFEAGGAGERSSNGTVCAMNALYGDFDAKTFDGETLDAQLQAAWEAIQGLDILPSVIIFTGGGYHCYWLLQDPVMITDENRAEIASILDRFVDWIGADTGAADLARILRVPGAINGKPRYAVRTVEERTAKFLKCDLDLTFTLEIFIPLLPPEKPIERPPQPDQAAQPSDDPDWIVRPGDDYAARVGWGDVLPAGWNFVNSRVNGKGVTQERWRRPGKERGISAVGDDRHFWCFSPSGGEVEQAKLYDKFSLYTHLQHSDNYAAAALALYQMGYGKKRAYNPPPPENFTAPQATGSPATPLEAGPDAPAPLATEAEDQAKGRGDLDAAFMACVRATPEDRHRTIENFAALLCKESVLVQQEWAERISQKGIIPKTQFVAVIREARHNLRTSSGQYVAFLRAKGYAFRWNDCTRTLEVNGADISDNLEAEIRTVARDCGFDDMTAMEDAYRTYAAKKRYHPIRDYLATLPAWDGMDSIAQLASFFSDESGAFPKLLKRFLIGAVAKVLQDNVRTRVLVLDGPQAIGKSAFAKWLVGPNHRYFYDGGIEPDSKDHRLRLLSTWLWHIGEIGHVTRRKDREALKDFLTLQHVKERKPFGRNDETGFSMCSFIASFNNGGGGILNDTTGHTRFMIAHITDIDWRGYVACLRPEQIWSQALALYRRGEPWELQPDELETVNEINDTYQVLDATTEAIKALFEIDPTGENFQTSREILEILKDPAHGN